MPRQPLIVNCGVCGLNCMFSHNATPLMQVEDLRERVVNYSIWLNTTKWSSTWLGPHSSTLLLVTCKTLKDVVGCVVSLEPKSWVLMSCQLFSFSVCGICGIVSESLYRTFSCLCICFLNTT